MDIISTRQEPQTSFEKLNALIQEWNSYENKAFTDMAKLQMDLLSREIQMFFDQNPDLKDTLLKNGTMSGLERLGFKTFTGKVFKRREEVSRKLVPPIGPTRYDIDEKDIWEDVTMFPRIS